MSTELDIHGDTWVARLRAEHAAQVRRERSAGASPDDIAAAQRLLGGDLSAGSPTNTRVIALRGTNVLGSTGTSYRVTERVDTVKGGTYVHCNCPGWGFAKGKGKDCTHVMEAKAYWMDEDELQWRKLSGLA